MIVEGSTAHLRTVEVVALGLPQDAEPSISLDWIKNNLEAARVQRETTSSHLESAAAYDPALGRELGLSQYLEYRLDRIERDLSKVAV